MTSKVVYLGNLRTEAIHLQSSHLIHTDAPKDNQGNGEKFSPTDLVATALGSCAMTIMGIAANTHQIDIEGSTCDVLKTMGTDPRRIVRIDLEFRMQVKSSGFTDKQKAILEHAAKTCPVWHSLHDSLEKNMVFYWQ